MKKNILLIGVLSMSLIFGCSQQDATNTNEEASSSLNNNDISLAQVEADKAQIKDAVAAMDLALCQDINSNVSKRDCIDLVVYTKVGKGEGKDCSAISNDDLKSRCENKLEEFTRSDKDTALLQKAYEESNADLCKEVSDESDRFDCYANIASALKDVSLCEAISDLNLAKDCKENF